MGDVTVRFYAIGDRIINVWNSLSLNVSMISPFTVSYTQNSCRYFNRTNLVGYLATPTSPFILLAVIRRSFKLCVLCRLKVGLRSFSYIGLMKV